MRLYNFEISTLVYDTSDQAQEVISSDFTEHESHHSNPSSVGFISFNDDLLEAVDDARGHYAVSHDITSLNDVEDSNFSVSLSTIPDHLAYPGGAGSDNINASIIVVSNGRFRG